MSTLGATPGRIILICVLLFQCTGLSYGNATDFAGMLKRAESGEPEAQLIVGLAYFLGEYRDGSPVVVDYEKSVHWLTQAADSGNSYAQWHLGGMYHEGKGVEKDVQKAAQLFLRAAESGNVKARVNLALLYFHGNGVEQDHDRAYAWASLASFAGNENAKHIVQQILPYLENRQRADSLAGEYLKKYGAGDPRTK